jgi:hypothetical protein
LFLLGVHAAHAQGCVTPSIGVTLGNESGQGRASFGASLGCLAACDPIGAELDVVYAPSFFGNADPLGDNSVTTVMGTFVFAGGSAGRYYGRRGGQPTVRPYVSGGLGVMHEISTGRDRLASVATTSAPISAPASLARRAPVSACAAASATSGIC